MDLKLLQAARVENGILFDVQVRRKQAPQRISLAIAIAGNPATK